MKKIDLNLLKKLSKDEQIDMMRTWFSERFEDPAQRTPYESREGGYIWIHGGPFEADDVLRNEFDGFAKSEAIDELV